MLVDDFIDDLTKQLDHIYSYTSGFDVTATEFIDTDMAPSLTLGSEIILFQDSDLEKIDLNKVNSLNKYVISEIGHGLKKGTKEVQTIYTLIDISISSKYQTETKLTEEELIKKAVSAKAYYTRLAAFTRDKALNEIIALVKTKLADLEHTLDLIYIQQDMATQPFEEDFEEDEKSHGKALELIW